MPHPSTSLIPRQPSQLAPAPDRRLNPEVAEAERVGIAAVARIQSGAFAASVAMQNATMLSRSADAAFRISPMGEDCDRAILMAYGSFATNEIQRLGFHEGGRD
jgi:hypothetical protein